jgi:hypothetical protein
MLPLCLHDALLDDHSTINTIVVMNNKICLHKKEIQRKHGPTVQQQGRCMFVVVWIVAVTV